MPCASRASRGCAVMRRVEGSRDPRLGCLASWRVAVLCNVLLVFDLVRGIRGGGISFGSVGE